MTHATALQHASQHRLARGLDAEQLATLVQHSRRNCERCDEYGSVYEQHTAGADPTTWQLCSLCHPSANTLSLWLDEGYADFLTEPQAPTYEAHVRLMHEEGGHWGFYEEMTPEEAIAPALASEQRRQAMLDDEQQRLTGTGIPPVTHPARKPSTARRLPSAAERAAENAEGGPLDTLMGDAPEQDGEPELERLRRLPTTDPQFCPNCDARMSGKRCYSCGLEQL